MPRPVVTDTTEEAYAAMRPLVQRDEENGWTGLHLVESIGRLLDPVEQLIRDSDLGPGWSAIVDVDRAPVEYLPWTGQIVGVRFKSTLTEAQMRQRIRDQEGRKRGTPGAMLDAISDTLTGSKIILLEERYGGDAYHFRVSVYEAQTPDPAATEAALLRQKPAGLTYDFILLGGATYAELDADFGTYADMDAAFVDYDEQSDYVPGGP